MNLDRRRFLARSSATFAATATGGLFTACSEKAEPGTVSTENEGARFEISLAQWSLHRALKLLHQSGRTFRVEKVPLCYMGDFAWASTETRKGA
jgi:hypothetical protein